MTISTETWVALSAVASLAYASATCALVYSNWRDSKLREKRADQETADARVRALHDALYDAYGYWMGHQNRSGDSLVTGFESGEVFQALFRLEGQLRLNGFGENSHSTWYGLSGNTSDGQNQHKASTTIRADRHRAKQITSARTSVFQKCNGMSQKLYV